MSRHQRYLFGFALTFLAYLGAMFIPGNLGSTVCLLTAGLMGYFNGQLAELLRCLQALRERYGNDGIGDVLR